ncbi:MAG TPA: DUF3971 domain-containing protein [Xanthobacteraceae bacterium]|nr:DUF3971 domain-containing protein [Xanthobacteraceae bacterium]
MRHRRLIRRVGIGSGILALILILGLAGLWWRLSSGPIQLDAFTPWLASAIADNFGSRERVEVGGTQIERTENGGAAVRVRDIVVRDPDGTVVASAPKAEIRVSGMGLLSGQLRAESLNLVGAELAVHIEQNGEVTVFASGADKRPLATASAPSVPAPLGLVQGGRQDRLQDRPNDKPNGAQPATNPLSLQTPSGLSHAASDTIAALLNWIDGIGETGLDGHDLRELGLKDGSLTVDDRRTGKKRTFHNITLSLERPRGGGIVVTLGSDNAEHPWAMTASIKPTRDGYRSIAFEARQVAVSDLLLAARIDDGTLQANLPVSASLRGEIGPNGVPQSLVGRIVADAGFISDSDDDDGRIDIDRAEFKINWDAQTRLLSVPFQILSGGNRFTLMGEVQAPPQSPGPWTFRINSGTVLLNSAADPSNPLILNRIALSGQFDPLKKRIVVDGGDFGNNDLGIALSGTGDYSSGDLRLTAGVAATRMPADSLKRLWPVFVSPKVRDWFNEHLSAGNLERLVIAVNAPLNTLKASGPPLPDDGLTVDALATNCVVTPVQGLPALHDVDLTVHIVGRDAQIAVNKATADLPSGRKLVLSSGLFEVPDTAPRQPPANVHFKIDGPVPAAAELLAMDRLRDASSGVPFDPATTHGTMSALVALTMPLRPDLPPGTTLYNISVDATNFSAEKMIMGQKVEAAALKVSANNQGFAIKGDVKIGGTPASLEYRKMRGDDAADVHIQGMLDETMRANLAFDPGNTISGSIPIDLTGKVGTTGDRDGRFAVTADLTPAQIDGFLPGWVKQSGKPARATFTLTTKPQSMRVDDLLIEGAGGGVKGTVELDGSGNLVSANFPSYGFSDGDRTSLKVDRAPDGAYRVVLRGDAYDGRGFIKSLVGTQANTQQQGKAASPDVDLDMKLGAILGYNGEALRGVEMKMSRRNGEVRSLGLSAKIGRNGTLTADLRARPGVARQVVEMQTTDAGAFFRFNDIYSRMNGGQMTTVIEAPSANNPTQLGTMTVRNFSVHDESQLEQAVQQQAGPQPPRGSNNNNIDFTSMKVDFTRSQARLALRDGVVRGPVLGGTIDGMIDYSRDEVHLRGTLVPLYGANNLLGQIPVVGLFLGGDKEGLLGVTYEVVGRPGAPIMHVNPLSALAPGLLRKVFEFPAAVPYGSAGDSDDSARSSFDDKTSAGGVSNAGH